MQWWPAGLQLTFFISALISAVQATIFSNASFRNLVGVQPLPAPVAPKPQPRMYPRYQAPSSTPSNPGVLNGVFGNVKGAVSNVMKVGEQYMPKSKEQKGRLTDGEKRHAKAYEEKRQQELAREAAMRRQSAQAKFEREQEQLARIREREEGLKRRAEKKAKRKE